tara:strand:+ start:1548 stop:3014 length:1467 start_codon:yes stop_codon:yes gene_type:complete
MSLFNKKISESDAIVQAISKSQAVIEFTVDGIILTANDLFLNALKYQLAEVQGKHHRIFVEPEDAQSAEYKEFWASLKKGEYQSAEYKRLAKDGSEIWIQASYNPIFDKTGKPYKIVKFATDITAQKILNSDYASQIAAISKSQAVIQFNMDGTIITANQNFLNALGYSLEEVVGKHHQIFVEPEYAKSAEYQEFWQQLGEGKYQSAEYKRRTKTGRDIWIQASYNPILDPSGRLQKVVKFASDVTDIVNERMRLSELQQTIDLELVEIANRMSEASQNGAKAAENTSDNVQAVSAGAEEMSASIREISEQVNRASGMTRTTVEQAEQSSSSIASLANATAKISNVIELINDIAAQTNMLALNATIEAARAGEAGKGFAVVASEVKNLAKQTSNATDEIRKLVTTVQQATDNSVASIKTISGSVSEVDEIAAAISAAVEEQTAVTADMSMNMQTASQSVETVTSNLDEIVAITQQVNAAVEKVRNATS